MVQLENKSRKIICKYNQYLLFIDVLDNILLQFSELNLKDWWQSVSGIGQEEIQRISDIISAYKNISNTENKVSDFYSPQALLDYINHFKNRMICNNTNFESDIQELSKICHDKQVIGLLTGKYYRKIHESALESVLKFLFWRKLQNDIDDMSVVRKANSFHDRLNTNGSKEQFIKDTFNMLEAKSPSHKELKNIIDARMYKTYTSLFIDKVQDGQLAEEELDETYQYVINNVWGRFVEMSSYNVEQFIELLFVYLNTNFLSPAIRRKIVEILNKSIFRKAVQTKYDLFRLRYQDALNWRFYNYTQCEVNIKLPDNFDKLSHSYSENSLMRLNLIKADLVRMYYALTTKGYISQDTDILDFSFALTGKPRNKENYYKKINWIGNEKKSLAIFLGLLRNENDKGYKYWKKCEDLFLYKGMKFSGKQLSSPFGKFINHPETRKEDWQELEAIINGENHN